MTAPIPADISEVTPSWLAAVTGLPVEDCEIDRIGVGIGVSSALYRLALRGETCPGSLVVKLPALDEAAVFTSTILRMYIREARFFADLAGDAPVRVPVCHHAAVDEETSGFVVVMEDLGGLRAVDQVAGMAPEDAERAVDGLALWHATWWGRAEELAASEHTVSLGDPIYPAILPTVFAEGWDKVTAAMDVPGPVATVGPRFADALGGLLEQLAASPTTMIHGDYRADNMFFDAQGPPAVVDFQLVGTGRGAYDLAYFVTQSLEPDVAARHERSLFERWTTGLVAAGVAEADLADAWDDYRRAALFCLVYPIVASRGMDLDDGRQSDLVRTMNERFARAVDELSLVDLLP
jgi:hypothetical protein